jgi:hypothetical protein
VKPETQSEFPAFMASEDKASADFVGMGFINLS